VTRPTERRALLVGVNYQGTNHHLSGSTWDILSTHRMLTRRGFQDIRLLLDSQSRTQLPHRTRPNRIAPTPHIGRGRQTATQLPTRENILRGWAWLCSAPPGSTLYFGYSGHGRQTTQGGELAPSDHLAKGWLNSSMLRTALLERLPRQSTLYGMLDCCHSGALLPLSWTWHWQGTNLHVRQNPHVGELGRILFLTSCLPHQAAGEVPIRPDYKMGLLSYLVEDILLRTPLISWQSLLHQLTERLQGRQMPLIMTGQYVDLSRPYLS
jgi:hypothetical protein